MRYFRILIAVAACAVAVIYWVATPKSLTTLEKMALAERKAYFAGVETSTIVGYVCTDAEMSAGLRADLGLSLARDHGAICDQ